MDGTSFGIVNVASPTCRTLGGRDERVVPPGSTQSKYMMLFIITHMLFVSTAMYQPKFLRGSDTR